MVEVDIKVEREKALIFSERKTIVHISKIFDNPAWINGIILEVGTDFFLIKDRLNGREYLILFSELKSSIEIYKERGE
jgi:hypothetical protein